MTLQAQKMPPEIKADEITRNLFVRYICSYLLYDYNLSHANNSYYNNEHDRNLRTVEKAKASSLDGRSWEEQLTWAYNQVLSEDIEELIAHIQKCGSGSRAQTEVLIAEKMEEYKNYCRQKENKS